MIRNYIAQKNENPVKKGDILEIYTDGASRGNPGSAACAYIIVKDGDIIKQSSKFIGQATNNTAEYHAIINALKDAEKYTRSELKVFSDSELVIRQINKEYRIKKTHLSQLCSEVYSLVQKFEKVEFFNVGRENKFIKQADKLCNDRLDRQFGKASKEYKKSNGGDE
ncbi:MAG: ribonuclease HI family protein [Candidatus Methanoperedens sp.]|nr:ribonuclease HI family protein [Candidatus Methanoperedens sp.]